ncbi:DNA cytosine methyltransferase [Shimazuella sp. AN120528]|uniref:DNA cytosine methyltransferase n=1 Tax=Shimazuella soli TaxID=1892854 RepID=UPI001F0D4B6B|nr:DNA cytosine methyltransferase [Shimazuella soli]MCH5586370.1 DNA cytosine methyltransferase [Shimazuella soli]
MNYIDLFAGAGGLSEGFVQNGFTPIAHVEMDMHASRTLQTRIAYHYLKRIGKGDIYRQYLCQEITREQLDSYIPDELKQSILNIEISDHTIEDIFNRIDQNLIKLGFSSVDFLIGGPPCQAYSLVGRARDPYGKENDPRNYLYRQYVKFLSYYQPKVFVFENVPGILTAGKGQLFQDVTGYMNEAGYQVEAKILNAADFGVLQNRKRVILIGWRKDLTFTYPNFKVVEHSYLVEDLLKDLPALKAGEKIMIGNYRHEYPDYLKEYDIRNEEDLLTQHISRNVNGRDREIYHLAIQEWNRNQKRIRYNQLPDNLITHRNVESFLDRFKVVCGDLAHSHTLVAHISKDGHYYIHPDEKQIRSISVREAARIQSFPDNYFFEGHRTAVFTQIGNAVPPIMAKSIAKSLKEQFLKLTESQYLEV